MDNMTVVVKKNYNMTVLWNLMTWWVSSWNNVFNAQINWINSLSISFSDTDKKNVLLSYFHIVNSTAVFNGPEKNKTCRFINVKIIIIIQVFSKELT